VHHSLPALFLCFDSDIHVKGPVIYSTRLPFKTSIPERGQKKKTGRTGGAENISPGAALQIQAPAWVGAQKRPDRIIGWRPPPHPHRWKKIRRDREPGMPVPTARMAPLPPLPPTRFRNNSPRSPLASSGPVRLRLVSFPRTRAGPFSGGHGKQRAVCWDRVLLVLARYANLRRSD
jgi:hypothetical protein